MQSPSGLEKSNPAHARAEGLFGQPDGIDQRTFVLSPPPSLCPGPFFSDVFGVEREVMAEYGAFDVSLINDLPLFIDPFLLFHSDKPAYRALHDNMIDYLRFLRAKSTGHASSDAELRLWYCFPEIRENWLGFSISSNQGSGLGLAFARQLHQSLELILTPPSKGAKTRSCHLEKIGLLRNGVGRDTISDMVTNLILGFLCEFTERLAVEHIAADRLRRVSVHKGVFNPHTEMWERRVFQLPVFNGQHVILTPKDILTRDSTWINRHDMLSRIMELPAAIPDQQLRAAVQNYFYKCLSETPTRRTSRKAAAEEAAAATIKAFPELVDYYIQLKEEQGAKARTASTAHVSDIEMIFSERVRELVLPYLRQNNLFRTAASTYAETHTRLAYLKHVIEDKGAWRIFYHKGKAVERELDLQILFKLVWYGTSLDASAEANDGRGPADFKISRGREKTIVEFKLASNAKLEANLKSQTEIYKRAADAQTSICAIVFFSEPQLNRTQAILQRLLIESCPDVVLIDARSDNKTSASKVGFPECQEIAT